MSSQKRQRAFTLEQILCTLEPQRKEKIVAVKWCYRKPYSLMRKDYVTVAMPHDENGEAVAGYWLSWSPFIEAGMERLVMKKI